MSKHDFETVGHLDSSDAEREMVRVTAQSYGQETAGKHRLEEMQEDPFRPVVTTLPSEDGKSFHRWAYTEKETNRNVSTSEAF